ncbi:hypothetical protein ACFY4V_28070 [Streptomyces misionensis]|uniref:hypothetical protein n=1 Tax=Streptomyces misionensis TaxID=67331 RepID=UPI00367E4BC1
MDTVLGNAALGAAHPALPPERRAADGRAWTGAYVEPPEADHPHLAVVRAELPPMAGSSSETALELLLSALGAAAPGATPQVCCPAELRRVSQAPVRSHPA